MRHFKVNVLLVDAAVIPNRRILSARAIGSVDGSGNEDFEVNNTPSYACEGKQQLVYERLKESTFYWRLNTDVLPNFDREDQDDKALLVHQFIEKLRKALSSASVSFTGSFEKGCEEKCIPAPLLATVNMLLSSSSVSSDCRATKTAIKYLSTHNVELPWATTKRRHRKK